MSVSVQERLVLTTVPLINVQRKVKVCNAESKCSQLSYLLVKKIVIPDDRIVVTVLLLSLSAVNVRHLENP